MRYYHVKIIIQTLINTIMILKALGHILKQHKMANKSPFRCPKVLFDPFRQRKSFSVFSRTNAHFEKLVLIRYLYFDRNWESVYFGVVTILTIGWVQDAGLFYSQRHSSSLSLTVSFQYFIVEATGVSHRNKVNKKGETSVNITSSQSKLLLQVTSYGFLKSFPTLLCLFR